GLACASTVCWCRCAHCADELAVRGSPPRCIECCPHALIPPGSRRCAHGTVHCVPGCALPPSVGMPFA
ncbi:hypothetical protein B0H19DRAFT_1123492, partial [Mycena capillaripes]